MLPLSWKKYVKKGIRLIGSYMSEIKDLDNLSIVQEIVFSEVERSETRKKDLEFHTPLIGWKSSGRCEKAVEDEATFIDLPWIISHWNLKTEEIFYLKNWLKFICNFFALNLEVL